MLGGGTDINLSNLGGGDLARVLDLKREVDERLAGTFAVLDGQMLVFESGVAQAVAERPR